MSELAEQIRYLECRLDGFQRRPELHRHQLAAYHFHLRACRAAAGVAEYFAAADLFELARAEALDRYFAAAAVHAALGDDRKRRAAQSAYLAALAAPDATELAVRTVAARSEGGGSSSLADAAPAAIAPLVIAIVDWASAASPGARAVLAEQVAGYWGALQAADPDCSWQRLGVHPPYRDRIPFAGTGFEALGRWLEAALAEAPPPAGPPPVALAPAPLDADLDALAREYPASLAPPAVAGTPTLGDAGDMVSGYRAARDALDASDPASAALRAVYGRILELAEPAPSATALAARMAEEGLFCEMACAQPIALARARLEAAHGLSQPHLERHYRELIAALEGATSPTEVEHEAGWRGECFAVETAWNDALLQCAVKPLGALIAFEAEPSAEQRKRAVAASGVVQRLFGATWQEVFAAPRMWDFFARVLFARGGAGSDDDARGVFQGEAGIPAVQELGGAAAAFASPIELRDHLSALASRLPAPLEPHGDGARLRLWGRPVELAELGDVWGATRPALRLTAPAGSVLE